MKPAGSDFNFRAAPAAPANRDWQPIDHAVARWVRAHGGDQRLADIAAAASAADGAGDSALRIDDAETLAALRTMPLVGTADSAATPFVIDDDLFYLRRNFSHEVALAQLLGERLQPAQATISVDQLDSLFAQPDDPRIAGQRAAVAKALRQRLFVLTGGPGTGKTTTVLRILMALLAEHGDDARLRLAAPTGKAAQRLGESLRAASAEDFPAAWQPLLAKVQMAETATVHRLLGSRGARGGWRHHADSPLPADIVVIDEASMLDLAMLRGVLEALSPDTRLILVGDADQLDSVGTGSVLQDIVSALGDDSANLQRLLHSFRADRALLPLNEAVRQGEPAAFFAGLSAAQPAAMQQRLADAPALRKALHGWADALLAEIIAAGIDRSLQHTLEPQIALETLRRRQLLSALREGEFGASGANAVIEKHLASALQTADAAVGEGTFWYPGRRVMITRNDPASGLFNGDIGICLGDGSGGLQVWFEAADDLPRAFDIAALPAHVAAFALTVHKAQGSEYAEVAVLLPQVVEHRLLSRQWLYTAISRARKRLQIWGTDAAITQAINAPAMRTSGLAKRIRLSL
ncbi:MAG: exodeoxyribonuclease V subunit alpha [Pseudomonadota bacterium]|nr:exodeoxyribonuclease V subunit alpha [Pseudomonadota bacterium]